MEYTVPWTSGLMIHFIQICPKLSLSLKKTKKKGSYIIRLSKKKGIRVISQCSPVDFLLSRFLFIIYNPAVNFKWTLLKITVNPYTIFFIMVGSGTLLKKD